ncbi:alpha/beta hydrolase [Deinococcus sp. YIM 134068]|uniref:alpha/beta fold hydrolase n=1 Tax=Deinococcus lichenicola TaxID=3118910 RepID=UPI002F92F802
MFKRPTAALATLALSLGSLVAAQAAPQEGVVEVNGARIAYKSQGQGPAMLLIHGFPLNGEFFKNNRSELSKSFRVITIDLRGFGRSTAPDGNGSVQTYAQDALAVMDRLGVQKAVIGGMSMGGPILFEMYRRAPERFNGMVLIATTANPPSITEQNLWKGVGLQAQANGVPSIVPDLIKDMLTGRTQQARPDLKAFLENLMRGASLNGVLGGSAALANRPDSLPTLRTIRVPTLIIAGGEDTVYPVVFSQKMQQNIPNAQLVVVPGAAHAVNIENAAAANAAILQWATRNRLR